MIFFMIIRIWGCNLLGSILSLKNNQQPQPLNPGDSICSQYFATAHPSSTHKTCKQRFDSCRASRARSIDESITHHSPSCRRVKLCGHHVLRIHHQHALDEFGGCNLIRSILSLTNNQKSTIHSRI